MSTFQSIFLDSQPRSRDKWFYNLEKTEKKKKFDPNWNTRSKIMMRLNFVKAIRWRKDRNLTNNMMVVGETGSGKTNVIAKLIVFLCSLYDLKPVLEIGEHLDLSFHTLLKRYGRDRLIVVEEAHNFINRYSFNSSQNRDFKSTLDDIRKFNVHFLLVTPNWVSIDKNIVNNAIHWIITCEYNDHKRQKVNAVIEYNCHSRKLDQMSYEDHSKVSFKWIPEPTFQKYDKWLLEHGNRKRYTYRDNIREQRIERIEQQKDDQASIIADIYKDLLDDLKSSELELTGRSSKVNELKEKYAIKMFHEGATQSEVASLLKIGASRAKGWETLARASKREGDEL